MKRAAMKLVLVTPFYPPGIGGSFRLNSEIADYLHNKGHEVDVLTYGDCTNPACIAFDRAHGYPIYRVKLSQAHGLSSLALFFRLIAFSRIRHYDLAFCGVGFPVAVLARINQIMNGLKYIVYSHGEDATCVERSNVNKWLLRRALKKAAMILCNSSHTRGSLLALGTPEERMVMLSPWIDPAPYASVPRAAVETLRSRFGLDGRRVILTLARLVPRKGHDMVVRALPAILKRAPDVHYLIVGFGDQRPLLDLATKCGVADRVSIIPYVLDAELPALFNLADVYAMPSRWDEITCEIEGFGIVYLEAAASGKPSVGANIGGSPDAIEDGVTGILVDPHSEGEIAAALCNVLTDPAKAASMGAAGRERVQSRFRKDARLRDVERMLALVATGNRNGNTGDI
jgi:phosphatidyl-myo-inositol dimannoside synthase